jgi:hypothetical protein
MLGIADSIIGVAGKVLDKFVEDKDLKTKLNAELKTQLITLDLAQAEANIEQAKHPSIFVSGARPAIMWVCCFAVAVYCSTHCKLGLCYLVSYCCTTSAGHTGSDDTSAFSSRSWWYAYR